MANPTEKADAKLLRPAVLVGRHPDTGVVHRLTINKRMEIKIERKPYVSDHPDGWTQTYPDIHCQADKHIFLILKIKQNPAEW